MTGAATGRAMSALGASTSRADPALRALTSPRVGPRHGVVARPARWRVGASSGDASSPTGDGDAGNADGTNEAYTRVSDAELRAAIQECRELLEEATRMAGEQARAELAASFLRTPEGTEGGLTGNLAVDMARVQLFFQGKGMRPSDATTFLWGGRGFNRQPSGTTSSRGSKQPAFRGIGSRTRQRKT